MVHHLNQFVALLSCGEDLNITNILAAVFRQNQTRKLKLKININITYLSVANSIEYLSFQCVIFNNRLNS